MKKIMVFILLFFSLLYLGNSCEAKTRDTIYLEKGKSYSLKLEGKYTYTSADSKKVRVSKMGKVYAKKIGKSVITAKKGKKKINYRIVVVRYMEISAKKAAYNPDGTLQLSFPAPNSKIQWKSSDEAVATVDGKGLVTGHEHGNCTISVTYLGKKYEFPMASRLHLKKSKIQDTIYLEKGKSYSLNLEGKYTYTSADNEKVRVSKKGKIYAKKIGKSVITAKKGKKKLNYKIVVVRYMEISAKKSTCNLGGTLQLSFPAPNSKIQWKSSDEAVATVDEKGLVTGHKGGDCIISVKYLGKTYTFSCDVLLPPGPTPPEPTGTEPQ